MIDGVLEWYPPVYSRNCDVPIMDAIKAFVIFVKPLFYSGLFSFR